MSKIDHHPELLEVINLLANQISNDEMAQLNYLVEVENLDPAKVSHDYLIKKGLIYE